jgi:hypothetical protein
MRTQVYWFVQTLVARFVYFAFILFSKTIKKDDVEFLPKAKKIEKILEKRNWIG